MIEADDRKLPANFAGTEAESDFAAIVAEYTNLVYSAAMRFTGDPHDAEEITQAVFIIFSRKAATLKSGTILSGWLFQTARLTAANFLKGKIRRQIREQEACMQSSFNDADNLAWEQMVPLLDEAMGLLAETDRNVVVLRFFEDKTVMEVSRRLKLTEAATYKRVNRALEKLRKIFARRGVVLPTALISGALSANSVQAAPVSLAAAATAATAKSALIPTTMTALVRGTLSTMTWIKLKTTLLTVAILLMLAAGTAIGFYKFGSAKKSSTSVQQAPFLIVPGVSVGKVRKGMSATEVEAILGKPEKWQGRMMVYDRKLGMAVAQSNSGVSVIFCGDSMLQYPGVKAFRGRTKEGIGMESSREEVIKAFGPPTIVKPWNGGQEQLDYKVLGLKFVLESQKVINITVDFRTLQ
ncbi:MAG: polymerase, sigma-24 subunit, subfamily [Verrucomicrobiales bacterium]|nr:polymerase, sigma-24 subunit, subfamily [Verrucomicrobiales bacterium]